MPQRAFLFHRLRNFPEGPSTKTHNLSRVGSQAALGCVTGPTESHVRATCSRVREYGSWDTVLVRQESFPSVAKIWQALC